MKKMNLCFMAMLILVSGALMACSDDEGTSVKCDGVGQVKVSEDSCGCIAEEGYVIKLSDNSCVKDSGCNAYKESFNDITGLCECNVARQWVGAAGNCYCTDGFEEKDNVCVQKQ